MITKCPNCGGALEYDVISDAMRCSHCNSGFLVGELKMREEKQELQKKQSVDYQNIEKSYDETDMSDAWMRRTADDGSDYDDYDMMECNIYSCTACGAQLMINDVESSTYCAYCSQPTIVFERVSMQKRPKLIIPFSVTKAQAVDIIRKRLNAGRFIPQEIKDFKIDTVRGIYVPYWMVDVECSDSMLIKGKVKSGKNSVTRYFYRAAKGRFRKVPIDASKQFNDSSSQRLEPFNYNECRDFNPQYLSGFYSDCSNEETGVVNGKAIKRTREMFYKKVMNSVNASSKSVIKSSPKYNIQSRLYMMIPVWFLIFRYLGRPYTIMVNGQTGKMIGAVPYNKKRIIAYLTACTALCSLIAFAVLDKLFAGEMEIFMRISWYVLFFGVILYISAYSCYKRYKESIALTMESQIKHYVSDRQEGM